MLQVVRSQNNGSDTDINYQSIISNYDAECMQKICLDIYNTLLRIERNNHIAKMKDVYSKRQISKFYRLKSLELFLVIKRIDDTKPKSISYSISYQLYKNIE